MNKQLNVNLSFTADTSKAKTELRQLQQSLNNLTNNASKSPLGITSEISKALTETSKLQVALKNATTSTGTLDLGQFRTELSKGKMTAESIAKSLSALGPEGQAAFAQIAQSVTNAEVPIRRANGLLNEFATTLKNTARWQISSSILHGFMGALQGAYGYAQDLNESLNNIRIVTGQSTEQMAEFARKANESAKALSATTTAYTDAALIFYQQGLTGEAVTERTDAVIKMSNVTGQSVEDVSSYMTAIWNNFDDGSQSLEHFADVITALGATTASSSAEIAGGLEKFAAVANSVGLSYEYATSALATVVATTRQSEEAVGTAFKTIFARLQGLKLGETLDDGVSLNKYSNALKAVGVEILDTTGEMKDLDTILDDLAKKWDVLTSAQKTALAQTVAGTRQYNQLIALMDNWDFMEKNLSTAGNAEGTLQEQADIYAESWEAAQKRVKAAAQGIYDDLLDDKFFISLTNSIGAIIEGLDHAIDSIGGLKGILPLVATMMFKAFGPDIAKSIDNMAHNISTFSMKGKAETSALRSSFNNVAIEESQQDTFASNTAADLFKQQASMQNEMLQKTQELRQEGKQISENGQAYLQILYDQNKTLSEIALKEAGKLDLVKQEVTEAKEQAATVLGNNYSEEQINTLSEVISKYSTIISLRNQFADASNEQGDAAAVEGLRKVEEVLNEIEPLYDSNIEGIQKVHRALDELKNAKGPDVDTSFSKLDDAISDLAGVKDNVFSEYVEGAKKGEASNTKLVKTIEAVKEASKKEGVQLANTTTAVNNARQSANTYSSALKNVEVESMSLGQVLVQASQGISSLSMAITSLSNLDDIWSDEDLATGEKFTRTLTNAVMAIPMFITGMSTLGKTFGVNTSLLSVLNKEYVAHNTLKAINIELSAKENASQLAGAAREKVISVLKQKELKTDSEELILKKLLFATDKESIAILGALNEEKLIELGLSPQIVKGIMAETAAQNALNTSILASPIGWLVIAITAVVGAITLWSYAEKKHAEQLRKTADAAKEEAVAQKEISNAAAENAEQINSLISSYKELNDQYEDNELSLQSLREKTYDLCLQYGQQDIALKSLNASYEQLIELMEQAEQKANDEVLSESAKTLDYYNSAYKAEASAENAEDAVWKTLSTGGAYKFKDPAQAGQIDTTVNLTKGQMAGLALAGSLAPISFGASSSIGNKIFSPQIGIQQEENKKFLEQMASLTGASYDYDKDTFDTSTMNLSLMAENYQDIIKLLNDSSEDLKDQNFYKTLNTYFNSIKEDIGDVQDLTKQRINAEFSNIYLSFDDKEALKTSEKELLKLRTELEEVVDRIYGENYSNKDSIISDWLNSYLGTDSSIQLTLQKDMIVQALKRFWGDIEDEVDDLSEGELSYIALNLDTAAAYDSLKDFEEDYADFIKVNNKKTAAMKVQVVFDAAAEQGSDYFTTSNINALYENNSEFEDYISKNDFIKASYNDKLQFLSIFYAEEMKASENSAKEIEDDYKKKAEAAQQYYNALKDEFEQGQNGREENSIWNAFNDSSDILSQSANELKEKKDAGEKASISEEYADKGLTEEMLKQVDTREKLIEVATQYYEITENQSDLTNEEQESLEELVKVLEDCEIIDKDNIKTIGKKNQALKDAKKKADSLADSIGELEDTTRNFDQEIKNSETQFKVYNDKLDEIQASYKALYNAEKEYTENGFLTADTYQQLLNLAPEYLTKITDETGAINLDKEAFIELTKAEYDNIAAEKLRTLMLQLEAAADDEAAMAKIEETYATNFLTDSSLEGADALAKLTLAEIANSQASEEAKRHMTEYVNSILSLKDAAIGGLTSSNFDKAMGVSSGSSKSKDKKDEKKYDDEFDRYHNIKECIEDIDDAMSDMEKLQNHLFGKELANSLREENKLLEQQKANYESLLGAQQQEAGEIQGELTQMGVTFDATSGQITNYAEATAAALETLNQAIVTFNASAQTEADKKLLEAAEKNYEQFKKKIEAYDKLIDSIRDTQNKLDDLHYKELENNLKAWEAEIQISLDLEDAERQWKKFLNEINKDFKLAYKDIKADMKQIRDEALSLAKAGGTIDIQMNAMSDIEQEIDKMMSGGSSDKFASVSEAQQYLKKYLDDLESSAEQLYDLYKSAWDGYLDGIDQALDKFDELTDKYEALNDELDHQAKVIELLYGEQAYDYLNSLYTAEANNLLGEMESIRKQAEFYEQQYKRTSDLYGENSEAAQKWKDAWTKAAKDLKDKEEEYIEAIQNQAINSINSIFNELEKKLTGGSSLDKIKEKWNDAKAAADGYYDDVERIYQLESLEKKWKDAINNTSSLKAQEELKSIMDSQLSSLENKTQLSEYDIELAEKRLAVYQAQIALEEAQNNKNSMKLTRGADGNWSYQYVADEDDISNKQQELMDKQNDYYEFAKQSWEELTEKIVEDTATAIERISELEKESLSATTERQAEIADEIARLKDYYWGEDGLITKEIAAQAEYEQNLNQATAETLWGLYTIDLDNYRLMTDSEKALMDDLKNHGVNNFKTLYDTVTYSYDSIKNKCDEVNASSLVAWTTTTAEMCRQWNSDNGDSVKINVTEALNACTAAMELYSDMVKRGCAAAGEDFTNVKERIQEVERATQSLQGATDTLIAATIADLLQYEQYLREVEAAWNQMKNSIIDACNNAMNYLRMVGSQAVATANQIKAALSAANAVSASSNSGSGGSGGGSINITGTSKGGNNTGVFEAVARDTKKIGTTTSSTIKNAATGIKIAQGASTISDLLKKGLKADTGTYTGEWNGSGTAETGDGKLAWLHQKELVLNANDTENMLQAVSLVRDMASLGSSVEGAITKGISRMIGSLAGLSPQSVTTNSSNISNDNSNIFNITAEFPNANNVDDIREAILSLPNVASQYSGR